MSAVQGLRVVVTGAATGIGAATARDLVGAGARVVLTDLDPAVYDVAAPLGADAHAVVGDLTDPAVAPAVVAAAVRELGGVDALANVAGLVVNGSALTCTDEEFTHVIDVNVLASLRMIRAALPAVLDAGGGSIVNVASVVGVRARQDGVAYVTAKAAVLGLTRSVALDFGPRGVRCNSVSPGPVDTPMLQAYEERNPGAREGLARSSFLGRIATGEEIAAMIRFLLGPESGFVNGADLVADGGTLAAFDPPRPGYDPTGGRT